MIIDISRTSPISRIFRYPVETNVPSNFFPMCIITAVLSLDIWKKLLLPSRRISPNQFYVRDSVWVGTGCLPPGDPFARISTGSILPVAPEIKVCCIMWKWFVCIRTNCDKHHDERMYKMGNSDIYLYIFMSLIASVRNTRCRSFVLYKQVTYVTCAQKHSH